MAALYSKHSAAAATTYADVENHALHMGEALLGTPGSITTRENSSGSRFFVRQYYDYDGRKRDEYLTSASEPKSAETIRGWKDRIDEARQIQDLVRFLKREGYATLPPKHLAAIMPLANRGVFEAGAVLVGTHAFDVIVNRMGIRAASFATEDVDVPPLLVKKPTGKIKEKGRSRFTFYLGYLLGETQVGAALSRHGVLAVRVPVPERFA